MVQACSVRRVGDTRANAGSAVGEPEVPLGIERGVYRGTVVDDTGYWARLKSGSLDSVLANALPTGSFVVEIKSSDYAIELSGVAISPK